tara:strand:+ start:598 stop:1125 length:528 start_codon:yes stop_codon:yes gene_type:complete
MSKPISTFTPMTDLQLIRESLKHCEEVTLPYRFTKDMWVKYITVVDEDEAFFEGGYFSGMGDHIIILCNKKCNRRIPTCIRSDDGEVLYKTRFFVDTRKKPSCQEKTSELEAIIQSQQLVIQKTSEQIKLLEDRLHQTECDNCNLRSELEEKDHQTKLAQKEAKQFKLLLSQYIG